MRTSWAVVLQVVVETAHRLRRDQETALFLLRLGLALGLGWLGLLLAGSASTCLAHFMDLSRYRQTEHPRPSGALLQIIYSHIVEPHDVIR